MDNFFLLSVHAILKKYIYILNSLLYMFNNALMLGGWVTRLVHAHALLFNTVNREYFASKNLISHAIIFRVK